MRRKVVPPSPLSPRAEQEKKAPPSTPVDAGGAHLRSKAMLRVLEERNVPVQQGFAGEHYLDIASIRYEILEGNSIVRDARVVSMGSSNREWIILDPGSPEINSKYEKLKKSIIRTAKTNQEIDDVFTHVINFARGSDGFNINEKKIWTEESKK